MILESSVCALLQGFWEPHRLGGPPPRGCNIPLRVVGKSPHANIPQMAETACNANVPFEQLKHWPLDTRATKSSFAVLAARLCGLCDTIHRKPS